MRNFDGVDDVLSLATQSQSAADVTMLAWTRPESAGEGNAGGPFGMHSSNQSRFNLFFNSTSGDPTMRCAFGTSVTLTGATGNWPLNVWSHYAIRYRLSDDYKDIVRNGISLASNTTDPGTTAISAAINIGNQGQAGNTFDGEVCFFAWFDSFLSIGEIQQEMMFPGSITRTRKAFIPILGFSATEFDYSGKERHFSVTGTTYSSNFPPINSWMEVPSGILVPS